MKGSNMDKSTDDEREALATVLASAYNASPYRDAHLRGADAILAAGYRRQGPITDEWEYAIKDGAGLHAWPFGPQDEELADTLEACVKALDGNDPDFWNPDDHIVRRRKHGPWEPVDDRSE
jgi:hypothetical protein